MIYLVLNWKAYIEDLNKAKKIAKNIDSELNLDQDIGALKKVNCIIAAPTIFLNELSNLNLANTKFASQSISNFNSGAYTDETTVSMLKNARVKYSLIGHSEVRKLRNLDETDIDAQLNQAWKNSITPILCIGSNSRDSEKEKNNLINQLEILIKESRQRQSKTIIAYEPIWAIGSGLTPTNQHINNIVKLIKEQISSPVLYGGSVDNNNIDNLKDTLIDGFLVGKVSTEIDRIQQIISILNK